MAKRGSSGLSLVVGVDKPQGMSSHDVVNRCRRIFGERRVGHTGTLDPLATGALLVCVGPATRLDAYFVGHDKRYRVRVAFGVGTDTDDACGQPIRTGAVPPGILDESFARECIAGFAGPQKQMPPVYSALKVNGRKACDAARQGNVIQLEPRDIEVYGADLVQVADPGDGSCPYWDIDFHVSKGTYIRSLARDIGMHAGCPAHVAQLRRTQAGLLGLGECLSLEALEDMGPRAALDPVRLLGYRILFADGSLARLVGNGNALPAEGVPLFGWPAASDAARMCACTSGIRETSNPPEDGEVVSVVKDNKLAALYSYHAGRNRFDAACVFQIGVSRGEYL